MAEETETEPAKNDALPADRRAFFDIQKIGQDIAKQRKRPLLLLFYSDTCGSIRNTDADYLEQLFQQKGLDHVPELDLIIHTTGGGVSASYFLAQAIRAHCTTLKVILPTHAYSGGTAICLAGNVIEMGALSRLSPIDIQLTDRRSKQSLSVINFDKFVEFVNESTTKFNFKDEKNKTLMATSLMAELLKQIPPMKIGEYFRMQQLHGYYAKELLLSYMFEHDSEKEAKAQEVVENLTIQSPSHEFDIDRNIAKNMGLNVEGLDQQTYDLSKRLIRACNMNKRMGTICDFIEGDTGYRLPYFELFDSGGLENGKSKN